jgi:ketosteroid isomerase-like protein
MKKIFFLFCFIAVGFGTLAQSKEQREVLANVYAMHMAIFGSDRGTKDSLTLENLFTDEITYGHSSGKIQNRKGAIDGCTSNKSAYSIQPISISVMLNGNTATSRYLLVGTETKADGTVGQLNLHILQVWVKTQAGWKMMARQAVKVA